MRQWLRKARITFPGGFVINPSNRVEQHELRVQFHVTKSISGSANTMDLKIWNLNEGHRNAVGKELSQVIIEAGYIPPEGGGNLGIIFKGAVRDYQHDRDGPDIITTVSCGDGDLAYRRATISKTIPKGASIPDVVEEINKELKKQGIAKGELKYPDDIRTLKRPYSMCGSCARELDTLGRGNGFYWSLQNETLEIIPSDGFLPGMIYLDKDSGLIGTPTITDNGIKVEGLLNPGARPNRQMKVVSQVLQMNSQSEIYRISAVDFDGDNQEGDFKMSLTGESISGGKVDEGHVKKGKVK
ncbi:putative structural protein [Rhizobium phage RHph_I72]|nr:putative structural protein [Rhizobium phage RHph_I65]QIG76498.1 putative structural protein [Rhizobium phage RHph_I72]